jgi:hypothetical protein
LISNVVSYKAGFDPTLWTTEQDLISNVVSYKAGFDPTLWTTEQDFKSYRGPQNRNLYHILGHVPGFDPTLWARAEFDSALWVYSVYTVFYPAL